MQKLPRGVLLMIITIIMGLLSLATGHAKYDSKEVIRKAQEIEQDQAKKEYLITEAYKFGRDNDQKNAKDIAEYIIYNLDSESELANKILQSNGELTESGVYD